MTHHFLIPLFLLSHDTLVTLKLEHSRIGADYSIWDFACSVCPLQMDSHLYLRMPPPTLCSALHHSRKKFSLAFCTALSPNLTALYELRMSHLANDLVLHYTHNYIRIITVPK